MQLKPGLRVRSQVSETEVIVIRASAGEIDLRCGGHPMTEHGAESTARVEAAADAAAPTQLGKRYVDDNGELEVLVTKAGPGMLSVGSTELRIKDAKPLPASD